MSSTAPHFLVVYHPAERFPAGTAAEVAAAFAALPEMAAHKQLLGAALARGEIAVGGPLASVGTGAPAGGAILYRGLDEAALQAFIAADPAIQQRLERAEVYRFVPALGAVP